MLYNTRLDKQIVLKVSNHVGVLHDIAKTVAEKGINLLAIKGAGHGDNAYIHLLTEDNERAADALRKNDYKPELEQVVVVTLGNRPGVLEKITERLAKADINLEHIHATADIRHETCEIVLSTSDNQRAVLELGA